ncbi:uncharacterized protein LOC141617526 [Silene latifolia]|uniref:uncharacterized protein LOC141617526 n=1 Tax=Silene latifolia TaxID=37657 RepID=UPI003D787923
MTNSENPQIENKSNFVFSLVPVENPGSNISQVIFTGTNYDEWSRAFRLTLLAKGKIDYINGTISKPSESDPDYKSWRSSNALVSSLIFNTIESKLRKTISYRDEATQLWADIKHRFKMVTDAQIYQLKSDIIACKQGPTETVMTYYGRIKKLWDDLIDSDVIATYSCNPCRCNLVSLLDSLREKKRVRSFLIGLNTRFSILRFHILGTEPLPNMNQIYSRLLQEEGIHNNLNTPPSDTCPDTMIYTANAAQGGRHTGGTP